RRPSGRGLSDARAADSSPHLAARRQQPGADKGETGDDRAIATAHDRRLSIDHESHAARPKPDPALDDQRVAGATNPLFRAGQAAPSRIGEFSDRSYTGD